MLKQKGGAYGAHCWWLSRFFHWCSLAANCKNYNSGQKGGIPTRYDLLISGVIGVMIGLGIPARIILRIKEKGG